MDSKTMLVDTNVWLDDCLVYRPNHKQSKEFLLKASSTDLNLVFAPHQTKDVFGLVGKLTKECIKRESGTLTQADASFAKQYAWSYLDYMSAVATPIACDVSDVWLAQKQRKIHGEYEDDLVIAAAMRAGATIITNDEKLIKHCPVAVLTVDDAMKYLDTL